jgi:hypothetical protein
MEVRAAEETRFHVTTLARTIDESSGLQISQAAIERALGLHGAFREQIAASEDFAKRLLGVDGTG